jgi:hypothetical protein
MGSQTIIDIIASTVVFGALLLNVFQLNYGTSESIQDYRGDLIVQQNLVAVTTLLEYDFRKIGYCLDYKKIPIATNSIRYADTSKIVFWTDLATGGPPYEGDGNVDSLAYYVGPTSELANTPNPNDRLLYRVVNDGTPVGVGMGVTIFNLQYYDAFHNKLATPVADPREIQSLQITIQVENPIKFTKYYNSAASDTLYQSASWRQIRMIARNLNNR